MPSKAILAILCFIALGSLDSSVQAQDQGATQSSEKDILTVYNGPHNYKRVSVAGKTTEMYIDDKRVADNEVPKYDSLIQVMAAQSKDSDREDPQGEGDREQGARDREQGARDREQGARDREQGARDREQAERDRQQGERDRQQGERDRQQGERDRQQGERDRQQAKEERVMMRSLIQFLVDKKIVADADHFSSLVLTDSALCVNGVRQADSLHDALKEQYSLWAGHGLSYGDGHVGKWEVHFSKFWGCCDWQ